MQDSPSPDDGLDRDFSKSEVESALKRGPDRLLRYQMQYRSGLRRAQAIDVAIWCALGHSRVALRTMPNCAVLRFCAQARCAAIARRTNPSDRAVVFPEPRRNTEAAGYRYTK